MGYDFEVPPMLGPPLVSEGSGITALTAVATDWTRVTSANPRRRWLTLVVPNAEGDSLLVSLPSKSDPTVGAIFLLSPGQTLVLSRTGDIPWEGIVYVRGYGADSTFIWGEVNE